MEVELTAANFEAEVLESDLPVLVDFWATWCGPCMMLGPVVAEIAAERAGSLKVGKVNVDEQPGLAVRFEVLAIPTLVIFRNGVPTETLTGVQKPAELIEKLKN